MNFPCPYLNADVELTEERAAHIQQRHLEIRVIGWKPVEQTVADPDCILDDSQYPSTILLVKWFAGLMDGKYVVAVVKLDPPPAVRCWMVTAYVSRKSPHGAIQWQRP